MTLRNTASNFVTGIIALCALIVTTLMVRRELFHAGFNSSVPRANIEVADFASYAAVGHRIGPDNAPVKIVEFGDFECPACGSFARGTLRGIRAKFPNQVQLIFRHWPLPYHKFAYPAARAAECAGVQGRFEPFFDALYSNQDSLGLKPFDQYATESGVPDLKAFRECAAAATKPTAIEADIAAATKLGGHGTPTVMINGVEIANAFDSVAVDRMVRADIAAAHR